MPNIIVTGNPVDGFEFIGPFPDHFDIPERHTARLDEWWIAPLRSYDSSITSLELDETELFNLELFAREDAVEISSFDLSRDYEGKAWATREETLYDLTNGLVSQPAT